MIENWWKANELEIWITIAAMGAVLLWYVGYRLVWLVRRRNAARKAKP